MPFARLTDRAVLTVTGEPAQHFLQTLVTGDLDRLAESEARPSALLTPQGKILFDFLVSRRTGGFRLDCAAAARADLVKRLTLYRLRTKVAIESLDLPVFAVWDEGSSTPSGLIDRRFPDEAVARLYGDPPQGIDESSPEAFEALRIRNGVAEAEKDFPASDVFPHDVLLDQNGGVSFRKGCFVGQEVVSRMQHRGTARRRLMLLRAEGHLSPGANISAGGKTIGTVLASTGSDGMGLVRIDRLVAAMDGGEEISADGVPVEATIPNWAGYTLPTPDAAGPSGEDAA